MSYLTAVRVTVTAPLPPPVMPFSFQFPVDLNMPEWYSLCSEHLHWFCLSSFRWTPCSMGGTVNGTVRVNYPKNFPPELFLFWFFPPSFILGWKFLQYQEENDVHDLKCWISWWLDGSFPLLNIRLTAWLGLFTGYDPIGHRVWIIITMKKIGGVAIREFEHQH